MWKLLLTLKVTGVVKPFEKQQGSCLDRIAYIGKRLELGDRILPLSGAGVFPSWWNAAVEDSVCNQETQSQGQPVSHWEVMGNLTSLSQIRELKYFLAHLLGVFPEGEVKG